MKSIFLSFILLLHLPSSSSSGYKVGDKVETFSLVNLLDRKTVHLSDFASKKAIVLIFTSHSCPYSKIYEERLLSLIEDFKNQDISFIFISSKLDNHKEVIQHAIERGYNSPILSDSRNMVARKFSATRTPETFVLKNMKGNMVLQYRGAIDDSPQDPKDVRMYYLKDAIEAVLTDGAMRIMEKRPTGCVLK